jgi:hypothetical protein
MAEAGPTGIVRLLRQCKSEAKTRLVRLPMIGQVIIAAVLKRHYKLHFGRSPRLNPPISFNERILYRILYDRDPRLKTICDKIAARGFIEKRVGPHYVVPLLGVWKSAAEIDWNHLPDRFVLKPNHASGLIVMVRDASDRDPQLLAKKARRMLGFNFFAQSLEWGYRDIPRRLLAEPLLTGPDGGPPIEVDVFTFAGRAGLIRVCTGGKLSRELRDNWFDSAGVRLPFRVKAIPGDYVLTQDQIRMLVPIAERIATGFDHLRVDFSLTDSGPKIGELTPYHVGGHQHWNPPEWDETLGRLWDNA